MATIASFDTERKAKLFSNIINKLKGYPKKGRRRDKMSTSIYTQQYVSPVKIGDEYTVTVNGVTSDIAKEAYARRVTANELTSVVNKSKEFTQLQSDFQKDLGPAFEGEVSNDLMVKEGPESK